jgi:hypothetical protein
VPPNVWCSLRWTMSESRATQKFNHGEQARKPNTLCGRESGNIVPGAFTPVLAKHSKSFPLIDCIWVGVERMQCTFQSMRKQVAAWQRSELTDVTAKVVIYEAFVEGKLEAPKHLARTVHDLYFEPLRIARRNGSKYRSCSRPRPRCNR